MIGVEPSEALGAARNFRAKGSEVEGDPTAYGKAIESMNDLDKILGVLEYTLVINSAGNIEVKLNEENEKKDEGEGFFKKAFRKVLGDELSDVRTKNQLSAVFILAEDSGADKLTPKQQQNLIKLHEENVEIAKKEQYH